ncbi:MAG: molybdopterin molybdotransferase MoeA [Clostridiales Family XIII bacterium]|jgi:molybdopterin molybdotransferase|nr:molybdopterin molybdotransferase MoeA [Clostridiales Family XIII bacterium]
MLCDINLEEATELICSGVRMLESEETALISAIGRINAEDVLSPVDQPPFPRSPLDGYAFFAADSEDAAPENPAALMVVDKIYAGAWSDRTVRRGEAVKLMTGAAIPLGCDCVVRQEDTDGGEETVKVCKRLKPNENYCFAGEDYMKGDLLLPAFARIDPAAMAAIAGAGFASLKLIRRPRVSVLSTGDELTPPGEPLGNGKIYCGNNLYIEARLVEMGAEVIMSRIVRDDPDAMKACFEAASAKSDAVISTGGVSVGEKDLVVRVLESMGADIIFHGVNIKPGSPAVFSKHKGARLLSLSGNPFASAASFELLARPMFAAMTGDSTLRLARASAELADDFNKKGGARRFIRGRFDGSAVHLPDGHSNGQIRSMIGCNCLVDVPADSAELKTGERVSVLLFPGAPISQPNDLKG